MATVRADTVPTAKPNDRSPKNAGLGISSIISGITIYRSLLLWRVSEIMLILELVSIGARSERDVTPYRIYTFPGHRLPR
jgi:hypothetical protein